MQRITADAEDFSKLVNDEEVCAPKLIMMLASPDTTVKLISYDYLSKKCMEQPSLSLLAANHVMRDCKDANYHIRNASLYALSSMSDMVETALKLLAEAMNDSSEIVRKKVPICCIRLASHSRDIVVSSELVELLYRKIRDDKLSVSTNCLVALEHILKEEGGIKMSKKLAKYIASRLKNAEPCHASIILHFLNKYKPDSEEELFDMLQKVDVCLTTANASVIISSIHLFQTFTVKHPNLMNDMLVTCAPSIINICENASPELINELLLCLMSLKLNSYCHISILQDSLLPKIDDKLFLHSTQLKMLPLLVRDSECLNVTKKLEYAFKNESLCLKVLQCYGKLSKKSMEAADKVVSLILNDLPSRKPELIIESLWILYFIIQDRSDELDTISEISTMFEIMADWLRIPEIIAIDPSLIMCCLEKCAGKFSRTQVHAVCDLLLNRCKSLASYMQEYLVTTAAIVVVWVPDIGQRFISDLYCEIGNTTNLQLKLHMNKTYSILKKFKREQWAQYWGVHWLPLN